ncbi:MAG: thioesterase family protein [Halobacteriovoraceae bacterium]|nr:thioesterase family protein [Halobacteriovoraceae bacterium]
MSNSVFKYSVVINARHLDVFGHVNNATYLQFYEDARWELIEKGGFGHERIMREKTGPVILKIELNFKKELLNRDKITIETFCRKVKGSKIMFIKQNMLKEDSSLASSLDITMGLLDMDKRRLISLTPKWLEAFGL